MGDDVGICHECYRWYDGRPGDARCREDSESEGGLRKLCRPTPQPCGRKCQVVSGFWPCKYGCDLVNNHEGVHTCLYHLGSGPAPTPIDERNRMLEEDHEEANASCRSGVSCSSDGKETTGGLEQDDRSYRSEVRFCRTTGAYSNICRECRDGSQGDRPEEPLSPC